MREILFRGKRIDNGEWIQGDLVQFPVHGIVRIVEQEPSYKDAEVDLDTVGQYTGLTDKNGKKIFEGDICRIKEHGDVDLAVISFEHGAFYATPHNANIHEHTLWDIWYNDYDIEVNSNIYDSPELLKEKE